MIFISLITALIITFLGVLHALWGLRIWWPIREERALARASAGFKDIDAMPPRAACWFVAVALFLLADLILLAVFTSIAPKLIQVLLLLAALVFLARGIIGFLPFWHRVTPEQPFRRLDLRYYSPLCLLLGLGIAATAFS